MKKRNGKDQVGMQIRPQQQLWSSFSRKSTLRLRQSQLANVASKKMMLKRQGDNSLRDRAARITQNHRLRWHRQSRHPIGRFRSHSKLSHSNSSHSKSSHNHSSGILSSSRDKKEEKSLSKSGPWNFFEDREEKKKLSVKNLNSKITCHLKRYLLHCAF